MSVPYTEAVPWVEVTVVPVMLPSPVPPQTKLLAQTWATPLVPVAVADELLIEPVPVL